MKRLLKITLLVSLSCLAAPVQKEYTVTSTTSYASIGNNANTVYNHMTIQNYTDGDIAVAIGSTSFADFTVKKNTDYIIDGYKFQGTISVKNVTGTGGTVIIRPWFE